MKGRRSLVKTNKTCANCAFSQEVHQKHEKIRIATCMIGQVNKLEPKIQNMKRNQLSKEEKTRKKIHEADCKKN